MTPKQKMQKQRHRAGDALARCEDCGVVGALCGLAANALRCASAVQFFLAVLLCVFVQCWSLLLGCVRVCCLQFAL